MKRLFQISIIVLSLCGFMVLTSCGGSSTGPDENIDTRAPTSPANLSGNSGNQEVELFWDANSEDDLAGYNLYRSTSSFSDLSDMNPINNPDLIRTTDFIDTGLENGTTYYYRLTAVDDSDNESNMSSLLEITPFSDPPSHP